ncbi:MAG: hypothetical protein H8E44_45355, partial [Planctomycetes bacterium]|nr:hypothetical protein [Planctomycetota bacterium]
MKKTWTAILTLCLAGCGGEEPAGPRSKEPTDPVAKKPGGPAAKEPAGPDDTPDTLDAAAAEATAKSLLDAFKSGDMGAVKGLVTEKAKPNMDDSSMPDASPDDSFVIKKAVVEGEKARVPITLVTGGEEKPAAGPLRQGGGQRRGRRRGVVGGAGRGGGAPWLGGSQEGGAHLFSDGGR